MLKVALAQMNTCGSIADNQTVIRQFAQQAGEADVHCLLLPEMCLSLESDDYSMIANDSAYIEFFSQLARHHNIAILVGAIPQSSPIDGQYPRSSQLLFDNQGQLVERYDKRHLFDVEVDDPQGCYRESDCFSAGKMIRLCDLQKPLSQQATSPHVSQPSSQHLSQPVLAAGTEAGHQAKLGMSICFDLRFPDHYQRLRQAGAEVMVVAAAFTFVTGQAHWQILLQARAIETQSYVIAVNQCGWHDDKRQSWGHSMVIDPWGKIIASLGHQPGLLITELDLDEVQRRRQQMPLKPCQ